MSTKPGRSGKKTLQVLTVAPSVAMFVTDRPGLPAEQHAGSLLRLLTGSKLGSFAPKGRHIAPISEQACGNTAPKMVNISNFAHKFAPQA